jgi:hypothetical protein
MTDAENYADLIDGTFGPGTTAFNRTVPVFNRVIGALNNPAEFFLFKTNFLARLERLKRIYASEPGYLQDILVQVNEMASEKNWEGAFAELVAYDHLNQDMIGRRTYLHTPIRPNVTLNSAETYAFELGKTSANLDGFVENRPFYFDVKCFKDNVTEILEGIYKDLARHLGRNDFHIAAEYSLAMSYEDFQTKRRELLDELKTRVRGPENTMVSSRVIEGVVFRIHWGPGISFAVRSYDPFEHAENFHPFVFNYADKFLKSEPCLIVLVIFPWYNSIGLNLKDGNVDMYRSMARRVFCQYRHSTAAFSTLNKRFRGSQTIFEVSQSLSGILFLEDNTILSEEPDKTNVRSFVYLNPNANNSMVKTLAWDLIRGLHNSAYDDFEHDNY